MKEYIDKSELTKEILSRIDDNTRKGEGVYDYCEVLSILGELKIFYNPVELDRVSYTDLRNSLQTHAESYAFNTESLLFPQLNKDQQVLWAQDLVRAVISGSEVAIGLVGCNKVHTGEIELDKECERFVKTKEFTEDDEGPVLSIAKHFFELGLRYFLERNVLKP